MNAPQPSPAPPAEITVPAASAVSDGTAETDDAESIGGVHGIDGIDGWASRLWDALVTGDERAAGATAFAALDAGVDPEALLLDVIGAAQRRIGAEWAANRLTVAQEHAATAINERIVAALALSPAMAAARSSAGRGRVTVACVDGEWHAFPARLLAQVLELRGWQVDYLGAQVPTPHLIAHLHRTAPRAVALSASLSTRLPTAHAAITACQATGTPVLAGGAGFGPQGRYAHRLGADAWAPDARATADRLGRGLPAPMPDHQAPDDLPHLSDQEYTLVGRSAPELVKSLFAALEEKIPAMRGYTEQQRRHTAEDLAQIVDFLSIALYVDDPELFTGFLEWTAGVLSARGVPAATLTPTLDVLAHELRDLPRARAILAEGHAALARAALAAASARPETPEDAAVAAGGATRNASARPVPEAPAEGSAPASGDAA